MSGWSKESQNNDAMDFASACLGSFSYETSVYYLFSTMSSFFQQLATLFYKNWKLFLNYAFQNEFNQNLPALITCVRIFLPEIAKNEL